jgi:aconitate hydratase
MTRSSGHGGPADLTQQLLRSHLLEGELVPGQDIRVDVDQVLVEDATRTTGSTSR